MEYFSYQISVLGVGVGVGQGRTRSHVRPCHFTTNMSDHVILQFNMSDHAMRHVRPYNLQFSI